MRGQLSILSKRIHTMQVMHISRSSASIDADVSRNAFLVDTADSILHDPPSVTYRCNLHGDKTALSQPAALARLDRAAEANHRHVGVLGHLAG